MVVRARALNFEGLTDVSVLTAPLKNLATIVEKATAGLDAYSRFVGRNPGAEDTLEGILQLPATLWPESAHPALDGLKRRISTGMVALSYQRSEEGRVGQEWDSTCRSRWWP